MSWLGFFYGGNIAGAVLGSLLAGFYLLRVYDMAIATYVAVALNVVVARLAGVRAGATTPYAPTPAAPRGAVASRRQGAVVGLRRDRAVRADGARAPR